MWPSTRFGGFIPLGCRNHVRRVQFVQGEVFESTWAYVSRALHEGILRIAVKQWDFHIFYIFIFFHFCIVTFSYLYICVLPHFHIWFFPKPTKFTSYKLLRNVRHIAVSGTPTKIAVLIDNSSQRHLRLLRLLFRASTKTSLHLTTWRKLVACTRVSI